jgi:hypothetical protein
MTFSHSYAMIVSDEACCWLYACSQTGFIERSHRGVAQLARASVSKTEGRRFESCLPCQFEREEIQICNSGLDFCVLGGE